jgi:hypothetical protein
MPFRDLAHGRYKFDQGTSGLYLGCFASARVCGNGN